MKQLVQDPIDSNHLSIAGVNDQSNNQKHNLTPNVTHVNLMDELMGTIDVIPHKGPTNKSLNIIFSSHGILRKIPNCPLYIANHIYDNPTNRILIDPTCGKNVIIEEFLVLHYLYQDDYNKPTTWIKTHTIFV